MYEPFVPCYHFIHGYVCVIIIIIIGAVVVLLLLLPVGVRVGVKVAHFFVAVRRKCVVYRVSHAMEMVVKCEERTNERQATAQKERKKQNPSTKMKRSEMHTQ